MARAGEIDIDQAIVIALGSNLAGEFASSEAVIEAALARLSSIGTEPVRVSRLWRSAAWPDPSDPPFVNAVALSRSALGPRSLLAALLGLEASFGRRREKANAPRPLDLDLVGYGRLTLDVPGLTLPHPRAAERAFVMGPLAEIAPAWRHPATGEAAAALAARARVGRDARPI
ncbi:MAG: 2-amino-4-hydroxy-6-hydroxymethyldihydropteridine diphosphokinase [Caulobacteraceae bacterium]